MASYKIIKKSIDARDKNNIKIIYTIDADICNNTVSLSKLKNPHIAPAKDEHYNFKATGSLKLCHRPVIIGSGPAGLFCALLLALNGYNPIIIERGEPVDHRINTVDNFWNNNELNINSNVQFGEGGAGTFSDGKLNTLVKDKYGRNNFVLQSFIEAGAPSEIAYLNKPHIGTDLLRTVVKNLRERIIYYGGEVRFNSCLTDITSEGNRVKSITINNKETFFCSVLVMAIGHSARDTFELLYKKGMDITKKSFAIGVRIEHPQHMINISQYGDYCNKLSPADYKLTHTAKNGRSVYSFCMCPGGFVVNASSEKNMLTINGMSNYERDESNANSAIIVSVTPNDFSGSSPLAGVEFQRKWEKRSYELCGGLVPVQVYGDLCGNKTSTSLYDVIPNIKGGYSLTNLRECLPYYVADTLIEGISVFGTKINGFSRKDAVLSGVETRTSSPIRILRNEEFESNIKGIYPCGEGAGYAGGIMSAAMDGMKVAEAIAKKYKNRKE